MGALDWGKLSRSHQSLLATLPLPAVLIASLGAGKKACWRITDLPEVIFKDLPAGNFSECFVPNVRLQPGTIWKSSNGPSLSGQGPLCITREDAVQKAPFADVAAEQI